MNHETKDMMESQKLFAAVKAIAHCQIADLAQYCAKVDEIASDALIAFDDSDAQESVYRRLREHEITLADIGILIFEQSTAECADPDLLGHLHQVLGELIKGSK